MTTPSIKKAVKRGCELNAKAGWPAYDGKWLNRDAFLTASETSSCLRKLYFDKTTRLNIAILDNPKFLPEPDLDVLPAEVTLHDGWGYFERGHHVEAWVVERLLAGSAEWTYSKLGEDQVSYHKGRLSGTPDGLCYKGDDRYTLLEFKSYDPRTNTRFFPKEPHIAQVQQNMYLINSTALACAPRMQIEQAVIFYQDASNYAASYEYVIEYDEDFGALCEDRAKELFAAKAADDLQAEGLFNDGCKYCTHGALCSDVVKEKAATTAKEVSARKLAGKLF